MHGFLRGRRAALLLTAAGLCAGLCAQPLVSPSYYLLEEGLSWSLQPFFRSAGQTHQQMHDTLRGNARTIGALAFRQDVNQAMTQQGHPWWSEFEIVLAGGTYAGASPLPANNYATTPTRVFQNRRFHVPDWSLRPKTAPAPFSLVIPFDTPYAHSGVHALLFEFRTTGDSGPEYVNGADAFRGPAPRQWEGELYGYGCTNQQNFEWMRLEALARLVSGPRLEVVFTASKWVPQAPGVTLFGTQRVAHSLPYLCTQLFVEPIVVLPSVPQNGMLVTQLAVPYAADLAGLELHAQACVPDPTLGGGYWPVRASNGVSVRMPRDAAANDAEVLRVRRVEWPPPAVYVVEPQSGLVVEFR